MYYTKNKTRLRENSIQAVGYTLIFNFETIMKTYICTVLLSFVLENRKPRISKLLFNSLNSFAIYFRDNYCQNQ